MSYTRKIAHNTIVQVVGKILGLMFSVFSLGMITRYLGPTGFGYYTTIFAFLQFFGILVDFGLQMITVQMISDPNEDESKMMSNIFTLRVLSAVIFFIAPLIGLFFPYPSTVKLGVCITSLTYFFTSISAVLTGLFQKHLIMKKVAFADFVNKFLFFVFTAFAIYIGTGLYGILFAALVSNAINFVLVFSYAKAIATIHLVYEKEKWLLILSRTWPIALSIALNLIYFKADTIILSLFQSQREVGLYGAPYKILEVLINISYLFLGLLLPLLTSSYVEKNFDKFKRIVQRGFDTMVTLAVPMIFGTMFIGKNIMVFIAGHDYEISGDILKIIILATAAIFISAIFGYGIVAMNIQKKMLIFYAINAIISLSAYIYFIPKYSYWAAAWITAYSEFFILFASLYVLSKNIHFTPKLYVLLKTVVASSVMCIPLYFFPNASVILLLGVSSMLYLVTLILIKGISKETIVEIVRIK